MSRGGGGGLLSNGSRGSFHPGMRGRGLLRGAPPRSMGFHHRGGSTRGAPLPRVHRPPIYNTFHQQKQAAQNAESAAAEVAPSDGSAAVVATPAVATAEVVETVVPSVRESVTQATSAPSRSSYSSPHNGGPPERNNAANGPLLSSRGLTRGRVSVGVSRGRGSYTPNVHMSGHSSVDRGEERSTNGEHGAPPRHSYRGAPTRGRGGTYTMGMQRPPILQHNNMPTNHSYAAPVQSLKRGPPASPLLAKRGRYEASGPPTRTAYAAPKYPAYSHSPQAPQHHHQPHHQAPQHHQPAHHTHAPSHHPQPQHHPHSYHAQAPAQR